MDDEEDIKKEPVFYYSREHRLSRASPLVREMNEKKTVKRGLLNSIFGSKSTLVLFATVILIFGTFSILPRLLGKGQLLKISGNILALSLQVQEGSPVLGIVKKTPQSGEFYTGPVEIVVSPAMQAKDDEEIPVFMYRINFNPLQSESYRVLLPFGATDFFVTLKTGSEEKSIRIKSR